MGSRPAGANTNAKRQAWALLALGGVVIGLVVAHYPMQTQFISLASPLTGWKAMAYRAGRPAIDLLWAFALAALLLRGGARTAAFALACVSAALWIVAERLWPLGDSHQALVTDPHVRMEAVRGAVVSALGVLLAAGLLARTRVGWSPAVVARGVGAVLMIAPLAGHALWDASLHAGAMPGGPGPWGVGEWQWHVSRVLSDRWTLALLGAAVALAAWCADGMARAPERGAGA